MNRIGSWEFACVSSLLLTLWGPCWAVAGSEPGAVPVPAVAERRSNLNRQSPIKIAPETTYLTQPIHPDGGIDYISVIEAELSRNVTPQNNSAVPLIRAFGPGIIPHEHQSEYFKKLGIERPRATENDFISLADYGESQGFQDDVMYTEWLSLVKGNREPSEMPALIEWLKCNDDALDQIVKATKKEQFYAPLIAKDVGGRRMLLSTSFPLCESMGEAPRALIARSFVHLYDNEYAEAWNDLFACYRLARLMERMPMQWSLVIAAGIDFQFTRALCDFLNRCPEGSISPSECLKALKSQPLRADCRKMIEYERYNLLDAVVLASINKLPNLQPAPGKQRSLFKQAASTLFWKVIRWETMMREANVYCDSLEAVFTQLAPHDAAKELSILGQKIRTWEKEKPDWSEYRRGSFILNMLAVPARATRFMTRKFISKYSMDYTRFYIAYRVQQTYHQANHIILALDWYYAKEHHFPKRLDELCPDYLLAVPDSPYLNQRFEYSSESDSTYSLKTQFHDKGSPRPEVGPPGLSFDRKMKRSPSKQSQEGIPEMLWLFAALLGVIGAACFFWRISRRRQYHNLT